MTKSLTITSVQIDTHSTGSRWVVNDADQLAKLIAIITMGQSRYAAKIVEELIPATPKLTDISLVNEAVGRLTVSGDTPKKMEVSQYHRDGYLFEVISWIAARQSASGRTFLKDPHVKSTHQGLDGLMIELHPLNPIMQSATIFEDKCSQDPRRIFRDEVLPAFKEHHENKRSIELVSTAAALIEQSGIDTAAATEMAGKVLELAHRQYRASLAIEKCSDNDVERGKIFKDYESLSNLSQSQRRGETLVVDDDLRKWFQNMADKTVAYLRTLQEKK